MIGKCLDIYTLDRSSPTSMEQTKGGEVGIDQEFLSLLCLLTSPEDSTLNLAEIDV